MSDRRKAEISRRLERALFFRRLRTVAAWGAGAAGMLIFASLLAFWLSSNFRAWLLDDRLGPPVEISGEVVAVYGGEIGRYGYVPQIPFVELANGHRVRSSNPFRLTFRIGDHVIVEERTFEKTGGKKYRLLQLIPDDK